MGIIEELSKLTGFHPLYKQYKQRQTDKVQEKLEVEYFPRRVNFYREFIQPNDLVFDVGANVGNRVKALLECKAKIVAVEPQPSCVKTLHEKFGSRITIEQVGLSSEKGELEMQVGSDTTISTFSKEFINKTKDRFRYSNWEKTIRVPVTTMETLIERYGVPRFCKIDVEGFELQVLKGLKTPIPLISFEYCVPEMQEEVIKCVEYLHKLCPTADYNYSIGESMVWGLNDWKSYSDFVQLIKSNEFSLSYFGDIYIRSV
jgi:FkbM family methyltransferase